MSYGILDSFLKFYKEKLKLGAFTTRQADNLLFKELIKHVSGNSEWIKNFCQCIKEIIKRNTPDKKYNTDEFFVMGQHKQNQLAKIYSHFKKLSEGEIKPQNEDILKKLKSLDEIFKTTDFTKFTPNTEIKDITKEIDENTLSMKILNSNLEHSG
ncbi:hypothetical protein BD0143_06320 [Helicobacter pylori]